MRQAALATFVALILMAGIPSPTISTAQAPQQAKSLQFEVAAIKPSNPKPRDYQYINDEGDRVHINDMSLKQWVEIGFSVKDYALKAPSWLDTSMFDLNAKLPDGKLANQNTVPEMMKSLLIERFGLKWHEELQNMSGYELVPGKKVLLKPATAQDRLKAVLHGYGSSNVGGRNISMSAFAETLSTVLGRPVVDATHLSGGYDIALTWRPDSDAEAAESKQNGTDVDDLPDSVFTAVQEKLGLRLQSAKVPTKVIVVDQISRQPTPN